VPSRLYEVPQTVTAGGFRTISEVQKFAKTRLRRTTLNVYVDYNWVKMSVTNGKLLGFGPLHLEISKKIPSVCTPTGGP